jgi:hypothetical protein
MYEAVSDTGKEEKVLDNFIILYYWSKLLLIGYIHVKKCDATNLQIAKCPLI